MAHVGRAIERQKPLAGSVRNQVTCTIDKRLGEWGWGSWWETPMKLTLEEERQSGVWGGGGGDSEMAQSVKASLTKPDNLSLIPETHAIERKKTLLVL